MKNTFRLLLSSALCSVAMGALTGATMARTTDTCADPTLTSVFMSIFSPTRTAHGVRAKMDMVAYNSAIGTQDNFQFEGPAFLAWTTPQAFTVPFYQLSSGTLTGGDFLFLPQVNGNPPSVPGFNVDGIAGYAYTTQVCGSVPLYAAANAANSDHYWTTNLADHNALLAKSGWVDNGIPFYVLPLNSCSASCSA